jgi:hypothetical protein
MLVLGPADRGNQRQELRMIGRNIKHSSVAKWSGNDRGITAGDGSLNKELLQTSALTDIQPGTVGQNIYVLRNTVMGNLDCLGYFRRGKAD